MSLDDKAQSRRNLPGATPSDPTDEPDANTLFVYRGHEDDRPLLWRQPLNELVGALNDVCIELIFRCFFLFSNALSFAAHG